MKTFDVIIIGAGVSGSAAARELSRYQLNVCVIEKEEDVCNGTSKANSAIVHAGHDAAEGSLMAKLNVEGNAMMDDLARDLDIPFERNGSLILCLHQDDLPNLYALHERGVANGVKDLRFLTKEEVLEMEPNVVDTVVSALYAPSGGIICPFELNMGMAENAYDNGVEFHFNEEVTGLSSKDGIWTVVTTDGSYQAKYVVNAAGVYADTFHNMVSDKKIHITPRKGEYYLLDHLAGEYVKHTIFQLPGKLGKGVLITPTVHANILVGPTAEDIENKEGDNTTLAGLDDVRAKSAQSVKNLPLNLVITTFAGLRAHEDHHEFIIEEVEGAPGFIDCAGIESPGLTSSPAIGKMVAKIILDKEHPAAKPDFIPTRKKVFNPMTLSDEERKKLIKEKPAYGTIVCRCETVTEGEIIDAVTRPLGARSLDGVKRRTRAGMGRCQAGFCSPRVMEVISRELDVPLEEVTKCGGKSRIIVGVKT